MRVSVRETRRAIRKIMEKDIWTCEARNPAGMRIISEVNGMKEDSIVISRKMPM